MKQAGAISSGKVSEKPANIAAPPPTIITTNTAAGGASSNGHQHQDIPTLNVPPECPERSTTTQRQRGQMKLHSLVNVAASASAQHKHSLAAPTTATATDMSTSGVNKELTSQQQQKNTHKRYTRVSFASLFLCLFIIVNTTSVFFFYCY